MNAKYMSFGCQEKRALDQDMSGTTLKPALLTAHRAWVLKLQRLTIGSADMKDCTSISSQHNDPAQGQKDW